jgi:hypothetical protein
MIIQIVICYFEVFDWWGKSVIKGCPYQLFKPEEIETIGYNISCINIYKIFA